MAQHDYNLADQGGASFRADLNNALSAALSQNSGATEPATKVAYMMWADTTAGVMKQRNAANSAWITMWTLGQGAGGFPSTTRMAFQQTLAPTGWTKESSATYDNAALRLVTGSIATGGADAFNTVFAAGKNTADYTLLVADIPSHNHGGATGGESQGHTHQQNGPTSVTDYSWTTTTRSAGPGAGGTAYNTGGASVGHTHAVSAQGGGGAHHHGLTLNLKYVDFIIATKD